MNAKLESDSISTLPQPLPLQHYSENKATTPQKPQSAEAILERAECYFNHGELASAAACLERGLSDHPNSPLLLGTLGSVRALLGDFGAAYVFLRQASSLQPNNSTVLVQFASVAVRLGHVEEFERAMDRVMQVEPEHLDALRLLTTLNLEAGNFANGAKTSQRILNQAANDVHALMALGKCLHELGDWVSAGVVYLEVLQLDPANQVASDNLLVLRRKIVGSAHLINPVPPLTHRLAVIPLPLLEAAPAEGPPHGLDPRHSPGWSNMSEDVRNQHSQTQDMLLQHRNHALLGAVSPRALRILEVGCGVSGVGKELKRSNPRRVVIAVDPPEVGIERTRKCVKGAPTGSAREGLTEIQTDSLDCIIFGNSLERFPDPGAILEQCRALLTNSGSMLCAVHNAQHYSIVSALLSGDLQYGDSGILDRRNLRLFTLSGIQKLLLDAGLAPRLVCTIDMRAPCGFIEGVQGIQDVLRLNHQRCARYLQAYQYILEAKPIPEWDPTPSSEPLTFVACVSDELSLHANLLASPDLRNSSHQVILARNCGSAAEGLNYGLQHAENRLVVFVHQDVYLPRGWTRRLVRQFEKAERSSGPIGIAGVYGIAERGGEFHRSGHVVDRDNLLWEREQLPTRVISLDELLLVAPRSTPVRFDPELGFHFYGTDACLKAKCAGVQSLALDLPCLHNSRTVGLNGAFHQSAAVFLSKWNNQLPIATPCVRFTPEATMQIW